MKRSSILDFGLGILDWRMVARWCNCVRLAANPKSKIQNPLLCVLIVAAANLTGCQVERVSSSDGRPLPPPPREAPVPPPAAKANQMAFFVGTKPDDTNGNGYPDLIAVTVMLVAAPHPTPIRQDGSFVFMLYEAGSLGQPQAKPLAVWRREGVEIRRAMARALAGPCYQFQLSLLESGGDRLLFDSADLVCRFEPADGSAAVQSTGVRTIQLGRKVAGL